MRLADIYPADNTIQKMKYKMLVKRKIIDKNEDLSESVSSVQSANSDKPKNDIAKLADVKQ